MKNHEARKPTDIDRHAGAQFRRIRLQREMTQSDAAVGLGITFQQVQKYEAGHSRLSVGRVFQAAELFDVPVGDFFPPQAGTPESAPLRLHIPSEDIAAIALAADLLVDIARRAKKLA